MIEIKNLHVTVEDKEILKGVNLSLEKGEVVAIMGRNGSGKSTLANVLMGNPKYVVTQGTILFDGEDITSLSPDERAKKGIFLSFQHPQEIPGVTLRSLLRAALNAKEGRIPPAKFTERLNNALELLKMNPAFVDRYVNEGFSGGEKKRAEILQLIMLDPQLAILDETDSGLDVDALRIVGEGITAAKTEDNAFLIISHYARIFDYLKPSRVVVLKDGVVDKEGGPDLLKHIDVKGFD
jgi:Fe-S cluster assembly ATP-binding protein